MARTFSQRLRGDRLLIGSFVKTPAASAVEIAGLVGLDFVVLDQEHAAFTVREIDLGVLAGRSQGVDVLVRIPSGAAHFIQQALDLGAAGVIIPHVRSAEQAAAAVAAARFGGGERGYSNSPRFGGYGERSMDELLRTADEDAAVIVQVEDVAAVDAVEEIAGVHGIDAIFIGRADLTVAYGGDETASARVAEAAVRIAAAAEQRDVKVGTFYPSSEAFSAAQETELGMVILGSDQSMLRTGWSASLAHARGVPGRADDVAGSSDRPSETSR